jgi:cytochrome c biogenesis protein CcmG/thiol:disulfide interchange protein DsbE
VFVAVLVIGLAIAWAIDGTGDGGVAEVGEPAPDFTVDLLDEGTFQLSDHFRDDGRPLIVNLWASWCVPCREEMPALSAFAEANPGIAILGVAVEDSLVDATAFGEEIDPVYPLAFGTTAFDEAYPNFGLPVTYFLDEAGVVTRVHNGILTIETLEEIT